MLSMAPRSLWCLHGNLQTPAVWQALAANLIGEVRAPDLFAIAAETATGYQSWARAFNALVRSRGDRVNFLLGYSLGGRLALHALLAAPELWAGATIVAAHPGLQNPRERALRRSRDRAWARRFAREPLETVFAAWDAQAVFQNIPNPVSRSRTVADRGRAIAGLERFSLGLQADLRPLLQQLEAPPILYVAGKQDAKYLQLGRDLAALCPAIERITVSGAAHRVPWEQPVQFAAIVRAMLEARCDSRSRVSEAETAAASQSLASIDDLAGS